MSELPLKIVSLSPEVLIETTRVTIGDYDRSAQSFWLGTKDHDVEQNMDALLRHIHGDGPHTILDFGCGPGRDLQAFKNLGHEAVGLEGSENFVRMARSYSGCEVLHQDFLSLDLPQERFDGVFANASIFHVPSQELPRVLHELWQSLKPEGVFFSSNPRGPDTEGWNGERYGTFLSLNSYRLLMAAAEFDELEYYYRPPGKPRDQQPWLASVWRKRSDP